MESAIKDNWIQVRRLRCTRATVKALFIKQRETESGPSPREHVAHGRATWNMVILPAGDGGCALPPLRKYTRAVRVSLKLHAREAYAGSAIVLVEKQFAPIGYIKLRHVLGILQKYVVRFTLRILKGREEDRMGRGEEEEGRDVVHHRQIILFWKLVRIENFHIKMSAP